MTFDSTERGSIVGQPVELYEFTGTFNTYRMTSDAKEVISNGQTFSSVAIKRNQIRNANQEETNLALELELPYSHPMVIEYAYQTSPPSLQLIFSRVHRNDLNDDLQFWKGSVVSWSIDGRVAKLKVPSLLSYALQRPVPPIKYQSPCNHILGDARCRVDLSTAANRFVGTVDTINGRTITVTGSPTFAVNECAAGEMIIGDERRMIITNNGTTFTIDSQFAGIEVGDSVTVHRGCDHTLNGAGGCRLRHNNVANFGGFPLVPTRNPFASRL